MESNKMKLHIFKDGSNLGKYSKFELFPVYCEFIAKYAERSVDMRFIWKIYKAHDGKYIANKITVWPDGGIVSFVEFHENYDSLHHNSDLIIPLRLLKEVKRKERNADLTYNVEN